MSLDRMSHFEEKCRSAGLALTVQRRLILQELLGRKDHPTADRIYDSVRGRVPGISRTTVYRVLDTLVRLGAARKVSHAEAVVRFDPNTERHHHLVCESCGELTDLETDGIGDFEIPQPNASGFKILDFSINFTGVCAGCRNETLGED